MAAPLGEVSSADRGVTAETAGLVPPTHERRDFTEQYAVITGASNLRGFGNAIGKIFNERGISGIILAVRPESLGKTQAVKEEIEAHGNANILILPLDMRRPEDFPGFMKTVLGEFPRVDMLINNAGANNNNLAVRMKQDKWTEVIETNLRGPHFLSVEVAKQSMIRQKKGKIVNMASVVYTGGNFGQGGYVESKAGVVALTQSFARELGPFGIHVNAVAPGFVPTDLAGDLLTPEGLEVLKNSTPLRAVAKAEQVARAVAFFASPDSDGITGQTLVVDGGLGGAYLDLMDHTKTLTGLRNAEAQILELQAQLASLTGAQQ
ncbi:MAG: SDR family oxidoreductase [bacterium]|nr:SDR family oxidoreductase [bacterium]